MGPTENDSLLIVMTSSRFLKCFMIKIPVPVLSLDLVFLKYGCGHAGYDTTTGKR